MDFTSETTNFFHSNEGVINFYNQDDQSNQIEFNPILNIDTYLDIVVPTFTYELLERLKRNRILLIHFEGGFDKETYLRHLASKLLQSSAYKLYECTNLLDNSSIYNALHQEDNQRIYLFDDIYPNDVNYNLVRLKKIAEEKQYYLIFSTPLNKSYWGQALKGNQLYWKGINATPPYDPIVLKDYLQSELAKIETTLRHHTRPEVLAFLQSEENLTNAVHQLKTPNQINFFVNYLNTREELLTERIIQRGLEFANTNQHKIFLSAFDTLSEVDKLLVLGMSFFDGLYDDQFFAAMRILAHEEWGIRSEKLRALDYSDLQSVAAFFLFVEVADSKQIIQIKQADLRPLLIKHNWHIWRRHLLALLPIMTQMVIDSIENINSNWELFGSRDKRQRLRDVLSQSLSDFCVYKLDATEYALVTLAAHKDSAVQRVAAKAMARWRQYGREKLFFDTMHDWQEQTKIVSLLRSLLRKKDQEGKTVNPTNYLRATLVLTFGYAANQDAPSKLPPSLLEMFESFIGDTSSLVVNRIAFVLPYLIRHHAQQLHEGGSLIKFLKKPNFIASVSKGLALSFLDYPKSTAKVYHELLTRYQSHQKATIYISDSTDKTGCLGFLFSFFNSPKEIYSENTFGLKEKVKTALVLTLQQLIKWEGTGVKIGNETALELLLDFRKKESNTHLKSLIIDALIHLLEEKSPEIGRGLLRQLQEGETPLLIRSLTHRYLVERRSLENGDATFKIKKNLYPVWLNSPRPRTYVETLLSKWFVNGEKAQRQLAFKAYLSFAEHLNTEELKLIRQYQYEQEKKKQEAEQQAREQETLDLNKAIGQLTEKIRFNVKKKWAFAGISNENKDVLNDLAPILEQNGYRHSDLFTVLQQMEDDHKIPGEISNGLRSLVEKI